MFLWVVSPSFSSARPPPQGRAGFMSRRGWCLLTLARRAKISILHSSSHSFNLPSLSRGCVPGLPLPQGNGNPVVGKGATERPLSQLLGVVRAGFLEEVASNNLVGE